MYVATSDEKFKYHEHNKRENGNVHGDGQLCQRETLFPAQLHVQYTWTGQLCVKLCVKEKDKKKEIILKRGMKFYKYTRSWVWKVCWRFYCV